MNSPYQATALKWQQEKHDQEQSLEDARWRLEQGQAPTEAIEHAQYRAERDRLRRQEHAISIRQNSNRTPAGPGGSAGP